MRRAPRRPWRPSALLPALAMCDLAPTRYARPLPTDCARREGRLAAYPCSDESCRVFSAHYLGWILRKGEVLASRQVLQGTGVVDVDCPVCLGVLKAGEGVVTFHILECGHRCAAPPFTCTAFPTTASMPAVPVPLSPPPHPTTCGFPLRVLHRIHEGCWLMVKETGTASGAVRMCPLCRGASRSTHTFALKGELA